VPPRAAEKFAAVAARRTPRSRRDCLTVAALRLRAAAHLAQHARQAATEEEALAARVTTFVELHPLGACRP
jgi:hypothetical protein